MIPDLNTLRLGNDPRTLTDFSALKEFHPARPDVNWVRAHELCLSLFNQNGIDLQTCAWFTLVCQHQNGIQGLSDGLALLQNLLSRHWKGLWPLQTHARVEILAALSQQLIVGLRSYPPVYTDLTALYHAEATLKQIGQLLQTLELKHLAQLERLQNWLTAQAKQLENTDTPDNGFIPPTPLQLPKTPTTTFHASTAAAPISIKANATISTPPNTPSTLSAPSTPKLSYRKGFYIGLILGVFFSTALYAAGLYILNQQNKNIELVEALPRPPELTQDMTLLLEKQLQSDPSQPNSLPAEKVNIIDNYFSELDSLSPIWSQEYELNLVNYLSKQHDGQQTASVFRDKWQEKMQTNALTNNKLQQWSEGMTLLNNLSTRLDKLDEKPRSYITGSELKTIIFNARQHFNLGMPLEEELRRLELRQTEGTVPDSEYQRIDAHFKQLLNRYALIKLSKQINTP